MAKRDAGNIHAYHYGSDAKSLSEVNELSGQMRRVASRSTFWPWAKLLGRGIFWAYVFYVFAKYLVKLFN